LLVTGLHGISDAAADQNYAGYGGDDYERDAWKTAGSRFERAAQSML
jgi:hypothetical protein